jgi:aryl-alcohol dehydrogenase-like predicted oxidoreductase
MYKAPSALDNHDRTLVSGVGACSALLGYIPSPTMTRRGSQEIATEQRATAAGTERFQRRFDEQFVEDFFRPLGGGLVTSSIGIGTYLGECDDADDVTYAAAVRAALENGINIIDSSVNYRCQRSERTVGLVLRDALADGIVKRDEVIVCTKGGYIPLDSSAPATRDEYLSYLQRTFVDTGIVSADDVVGGGHALSPSFLAHQIQLSQTNLGVRTLDVYYLHNPEQQLDSVQPARFRTILRRAFALLEERVASGDIGCYGCATWNGLRTAPDARGHLDLAELVGIARDVGGEDHHFRIVQMPVNLAMSEAVRTPTQRLGTRRVVPPLQAATELGLSVVASATLMQARLTTDLPAALRDTFPALATDAQRAIAFVRSLPGVSSALVGMRSLDHVSENIAAASR